MLHLLYFWWTKFCTMHCIVPSKRPWVLAAQVRVGSYTEKVLKRFNYPRPRAHPRCEVSCQGVPYRRFVHASLRPPWQWRKLWLVALLPSFRSIQSWLAVHKFCAAEKEHYKQGHEVVCANLWYLMSWCPKRTRTITAMWAQQTYLWIYYARI